MKKIYKLLFSLALCIVSVLIQFNHSFAQGCGISASCSFSAQPAVVSTNVNCKGDSTGVLDLLFYNNNTSGGNYPYCFEWYIGSVSPANLLSNGTATGKGLAPVPSGSGTIDSIPAGTYILVTYNNASPSPCKSINTFTIGEPSSIFSASMSVTSPPSCAGTCLNNAQSDGSGGSPPYDFNWSTSQSDAGVFTSTASNLCTGNYSVSISDVNGCDTTIDFTIGVSPLPLASAGNDQLICNGSSGVTIGGSPTATAGTSPYTYSWSPNGGTLSSSTTSNPTANPGSTTTYTVTVTDANSCSGSDAVIVSVNAAITISFSSQTNVSCFGGNNGTVTATASGGTSPFTYLWSNAQSGTTATGLVAGTYKVTATDVSNCTKVDSVTITQPALLTVSISSTAISCNGVNDGSLTANPTGGTTNYSFLWSSGQSTKTINSLPPGTYIVTVTDAKGCTATKTFVLTSPPAINANLTSINSTCSGACNGSASISPSGGTSPYTISWSTGSSGTSVSGLCPGNYSVTILDFAGCSITKNFTITEPTAIVPNASATNVSCSGNCDGQVTCAPSGGTSPYTFNWDIPSTLKTVTGLCANTYNLTVTDAKGCTKTASAIINTPSAVSINLTSVDATCPSFCNGTGTAAPSGGVSPYTILWSDGSSASPLDSLCSGSYGITVTDATLCSVSQSFTITAPSALIPNPTQTAPTCNGASDGSACVAPVGGTSPYTFSWTSGSTSVCATGLAAGTPAVTITDFNGCIKTQSFTITEPASITTTTTKTNESCGGFCDGSATVSASGGTSPYTFLWSEGTTNDTASGLCGGKYYVTVTDVNGCNKIDSVTIVNSIVIGINPSIVTQACNGICNGTASATASGGSSPYNFVWSNGDLANAVDTSTADSLCPQTYYITATDAGGCASSDSIIMTAAPSVLQLTDSAINITCNGNCDGTAIALATGGTGPGTYTYAWVGFGDTDSVMTGLCPGTYTAVVIDGNSCRDSVDIAITEPAVLDASASSTNISCSGLCTGSATANQSGGTSPYSYLWNNTQTTQTATGLCVGTFTVTITDANGCTDTSSASISQPAALTTTATSTSISCNGGNDGTATVTPSGGTSPYSFVWSNAKITQTITGLAAGTFTVTVTDANGCTVTASATVSQPSALSVSTLQTNALCSGNCNGTATANPTGGTSPYTFLWSTVPAQTTKTATGLCVGTFTVTVTDNKGCTKTANVTITAPTALSISTSKTNVTCNSSCNGTATGTASGGTSPYSYLWSNGQTTQTATGLCNGTFTVTATDANSCTITATVTISQPTAITATPNAISSNCGVCDGTAKSTISGGTPPYTHSWNTGATSSTITNACAAVYTDTIRDAKGCQVISVVPVSNINGPDGATIITNNATCYATCTGSAAIVAVSGGTSPFTYLWPDAETDTVMTSICAGSDILQITDNLGCIHFQTFVIDEPDSLQADIISTDATCNGSSDGTALANPSGGTSSYTFNWSTSATTSSINGLSSGNYPVTVTDAAGCTVSDTADVGEAISVSITFAVTDVLCSGNSTGSITATPSGGTLPYSFIWSDGQTSSSATGLPAGTYSLTVFDANGCTVTGSGTVSESATLSVSASVTDATCGLSDGSITVTASGGNSPYTFLWLNGQNGATATGLAAGTESVIVTDVSSCVDTFAIGVSNVNGPGTSASVSNTTCNGTCNGSGSIAITSGVSPFTYLWVPGNQTTSSVTGLCAGNFNVEVTDGNNCTTVQTVTVSEPAAISASISHTNISCNGSCDGTATVTASGGVIPYTFLWSNGKTTQFISALCAGTFTATITDANGCTGTGSVTITQPSVLSASATGSAVACNGDCNGTATVTPSGGTPGYSYSWSSGASASIVASLCAANYTVTVTDVNGCTATASATVSQPSAISITAIVINTSCGSCSGTIAMSASGGTSPYTRLWSTGSTAASISNLCPNIFSITVTDASGCKADSSFIINNSDGPIPAVTGDTTSCFNSCDATTSSTTSGGTSPYTFLWDDPASQTTSSATGLCNGTFSLFVTDASGCIGIGTTAVAEPALLANIITVTDADCNTSCDVTAKSTPSGGTSPYTFLWNNGQTGSSATGLCSGTFFVTVTDFNNCTRNDSVVVNEATTLSLAISGTNSNCFNSCDGVATANVSGGSSPYSYSWSNSQTTPVITNLCIGTYLVTVTDNKGCEKIDSVTITEPSVLSSSITGTDVNCNGGFDGSATLTINGGTTPYSYNWSPSGQTDSTATGLSTGTQSVTVTDANGCTIDTSVVINQPSVITLDSIVTTNTACGDTSGTATVFVSGGTTSLTYVWSDALAQTTQTADSLLQGTYSVTVTYNGTCDTSFSGILIVNTNGATVAMDSTNANCNGSCDGTATASVSGGTTPYSYLWNNSQTDSTATGLCVGTYNVTVTDGNGCITLASTSVTEPTLLAASATSTDITCNGANNGTASVSGNGGTSPYTFIWSNGATSASLSSLTPGNYCVTVTDFKGCDTTVCVTINEPAALSLTTSFTNVTCKGNCNGSATLTVNGGNSPYSFLWSNSQTTSTATGLCAGSFTVTVTDAKSCTVDTSFTITEPNAITASFTQSQPACGTNSGAVTVNVSGGTQFTSGNPYNYLWSASAQTDSTATGLAAGSYSVTITDSLSCKNTFSTTLSNLNAPVVVIDSIDSVSCFGNTDGAIYVTTTGTNTPFTFSWSNGQSTEDATGLPAGNDTLTVTDASGCVTIADTIVSPSPALTASISATDGTCGVCNGQATVTATGGTGSYVFLWGNPQTTSTVTGLCAGNDSVKVTDANGCTATANTTINNIAGPTSITIAATNVTCFGLCDGTAATSITGGTSPFSFLWSNGQTSSTATALCAGTDSVTVTDANGCTIDSSLTITQPTDIVADSITIKNANCGASNGKAEIFVSGGTSPYTYSWSAGSSTSIQNGLTAGVYSVTVTDFTGCQKTFSNIIISNNNGPNVTTTPTAVTCNGNCDGTITANASGNGTPFTYQWSNGDTAITADSLCPGTYTVSVTNTSGCITIVVDSVNEPTLLTAAVTATDITCNGANDGSTSLTVNGGTSPYTFLWSNGATSATLSGLAAGNYCVTVTDASGCSGDTCVTITEPSALSLILSSNNLTCFGSCNGNATASVSGGVSPYSYLWSNAQADSTATGLCAGTDTVVVTDAGGCTIDSSVVITQPNDIIADSIVVIDASCLAFNGSATIYISGGVSPYSYSWINGQTNAADTGLFAGTYSVTVTDSTLCKKIFSNITLSNNNGPVVTTTVTDVTCNGNCNGKATASSLTGTGYIWSNGDLGITADSLCAGTYTVSVSDVNGCITVAADTVNEPALLTTSEISTNISCNGDTNGTATVIPNGGTSPYTFLWSNGATSATLSGLAAGNYCVTVTDANGCIDSACVTISEPTVLSATLSFTNVSCFGSCDGTASFPATGGTSPYLYQWSNGQTDSTATGLCPNAWVTVTDANGCSVKDTLFIAEPSAIVLDSINTVNPPCGDSTGTATANISGGFSPYTYQWDAPAKNQITKTATGLKAGTYSVTVTDSTNCNKIFSVNVSNAGAQTVTVSVTDISCGGNCDGSASSAVTGGTTPYTFLWSNSDTGTTADSLCSGIITVTVTDAASCIVIASDTVNAGNVLAVTMSVTNILCNGNSSGKITATVSSGTSPYTFMWSNGATSASLSGLAVGNYCVTVTDSSGCTFTGCDSVSQSTALSANILSSINNSCNNSCNGSATLTVNGGTSPYTILWSNADTTTAPDSLCAGTYNVTIKDSSGCSVTDSVTITEPSAIVLDSINFVNPPCGDSSGTATVNISGGFSPYAYQWDALAKNQITKTATGLKAGTYSVTVTDSTLCSKTFSVNVSNSGAQAVTISVADVSCGGSCNGAAVANVSGGTSPYTFLWNNTATTDTINNLCIGVVNVTVTDAAGCIVLASDTVNQGNVLAGTMCATNVSVCGGDSSGTLKACILGGTTPYSYLWSNGQTDSIATGLAAGFYCVTVTDSVGCFFIGCDSIKADTVSIFASMVPDTIPIPCAYTYVVTCNGEFPIIVKWYSTDSSFMTIDTLPADTVKITASNLSPNNYVIIATDANGCSSSLLMTIQPISISGTVISPSACGASDGSISLVCTGGTPFKTGNAYTYLWNTGDTFSTIDSLPAGTYCVTVTDSLGCFADTCFILVPPGGPALTVDSIHNATCQGKCNGAIYISASGPNSPFTYLWSNNDTAEDADSLCAGNYSVTATNSIGCISTLDTSLIEPTALSATFSSTSPACGVCDGTSTATVSGGTSPYIYLWMNSDNNATADSLCAGAPDVTVTDANGCVSNFNTSINNIGGPDSVLLAATNITCNGFCNGSDTATVFGGTSPYNYQWSSGSTTSSDNNLCAGNYTLTVTDSSGCVFIVSDSIIAPPAINVAFVDTAPACGLANGTITANASGGTPFSAGYTYQWSANVSGQTTAAVTGLGPDIFTVTVTDSLGCFNAFSTTLSNSNAAVFATVTNATCFGKCDGKIVTDSSSGTNEPFTYLWIPTGQTDSSIFSLCAGNYKMEITDALGCKAFQDYIVGEPTQLAATFSLTDAACGQCNGSATLTVSGGTSPYNYSWTNNDSTSTADTLCAGPYSAFVTDANLCPSTFSTGINNTGAPGDSVANIANVSCFGLCDGSATVTGKGGITPYSYFWVGSNPVDTTSTATGLCAGTYFVEISGANGCIHTAQVTITEPAALADSTIISMPSCGLNNGSICAFISGGILPYTYLWSNSPTTNCDTGLIAGIYKLTVIDNNGSGCSQVFTYTLNSDSAPTLNISPIDATCNSSCNGLATVIATGGIPAYTYQWLDTNFVAIPAQIDSIADSLCAGTYFVQVTDAIGCKSFIQADIHQPDSLFSSLPNVTSNICNGDCNGSATVIINGGVPPYSYLWDNSQITNPATALCSGNDTVTVTDANNCKISRNITITQPAALSINVDTAIAALCISSNNGSIAITVTGGTTGYSYNWTGPSPFTSTSEDINSLFPGTYQVTVTDTNSCDTTATVIVDTTFALTISPLADTLICENTGGITLNANASGSGTIDYLWTPGNSLNDPTIPNPVATPTSTTNYILTVSISGQCAVSDTMQVIVSPTPTVDAGSGLTIVKGVNATLGGNTTAPTGSTFHWSPPDGLDDSLIANPVALPTQTTMYFLTVITPDGCSGIDSVEITVVPLIEYVSGFSPNGDGINETWQIDHVEQFPDIVVDIFNRWGQQLFHSVGYKNAWDGTYNGKPLPIGTYYYVILLNHPKFPDPITGPVTIVK